MTEQDKFDFKIYLVIGFSVEDACRLILCDTHPEDIMPMIREDMDKNQEVALDEIASVAVQFNVLKKHGSSKAIENNPRLKQLRDELVKTIK